jgi:hypothetical protein
MARDKEVTTDMNYCYNTSVFILLRSLAFLIPDCPEKRSERQVGPRNCRRGPSTNTRAILLAVGVKNFAKPNYKNRGCFRETLARFRCEKMNLALKKIK